MQTSGVLLHSHDISSIILITQPRHQQYYSYYTATTSAVLFGLESPTYSISYLNWYRFQPLFPLYSIYLLTKLRGRNFCKVGRL